MSDLSLPAHFMACSSPFGRSVVNWSLKSVLQHKGPYATRCCAWRLLTPGKIPGIAMDKLLQSFQGIHEFLSCVRRA